MPSLPFILLLAGFSAQTAAPQASQPGAWPLTHLHETSMPMERVPAAERSVALSVLKPQLGPLFQGESSAQANQAMRSFRAERIVLAGSPALAVQPSGSELCGATGNCSFWIIDLRHRRILLNAVAIRSFAVGSAQHGSLPDVTTGSHASAYEEEIIRWHFHGSSYERGECATVTSASDDGQPYPTPKITSHPCEPEGN